MNIRTEEGWGFPWLSRKAHYFRSGMSLCRTWMYMGKLEAGNNESVDNCLKCYRLLNKVSNAK